MLIIYDYNMYGNIKIVNLFLVKSSYKFIQELQLYF